MSQQTEIHKVQEYPNRPLPVKLQTGRSAYPLPHRALRLSVRKVMHIHQRLELPQQAKALVPSPVSTFVGTLPTSTTATSGRLSDEIADYSSVRSSFGRMTNQEFINFLGRPQSQRT